MTEGGALSDSGESLHRISPLSNHVRLLGDLKAAYNDAFGQAEKGFQAEREGKLSDARFCRDWRFDMFTNLNEPPGSSSLPPQRPSWGSCSAR